jgi:hypothetical protein
MGESSRTLQVPFPTAREDNPSSHGHLLAHPVADLAVKVRVNFRLPFSLGGDLKDLAALLSVHQSLHERLLAALLGPSELLKRTRMHS